MKLNCKLKKNVNKKSCKKLRNEKWLAVALTASIIALDILSSHKRNEQKK